MQLECWPGRSYPLGATVYPSGTNFSLFSKSASAVELLLFDDPDDALPQQVLALEPRQCRTYYYWHTFVPDIGHGQLYGYRVRGPYDPERGLWFDGEKLLVDPYARAVAPSSRFSRDAARRPGNNCGVGIKSVVVDPTLYNWELDNQLDRPYASTVIYEMHIRGFTQHPSSGVPAERRDLLGRDRQDSIPAESGNHGSGAVADTALRCPGCTGRPDQLLGLQSYCFLRPAPGI